MCLAEIDFKQKRYKGVGDLSKLLVPPVNGIPLRSNSLGVDIIAVN